mgnify:CR=1 FL=1
MRVCLLSLLIHCNGLNFKKNFLKNSITQCKDTLCRIIQGVCTPICQRREIGAPCKFSVCFFTRSICLHWSKPRPKCTNLSHIWRYTVALCADSGPWVKTTDYTESKGYIYYYLKLITFQFDTFSLWRHN